MTADPHHDPTDDDRAGRSTGPHVHHEAQGGWKRRDDYPAGGVIRPGFMRPLPEDASQSLADLDERHRLGRLVEEVRDGGHTTQVGRVMIAPCDEHGRTRAEVTALVSASRAAGERDAARADRDAAERERDEAHTANAGLQAEVDRWKARAEQSRPLTAREHLDAAWDAAHVPADGMIPAGAEYLVRFSPGNYSVRENGAEPISAEGAFTRRLLDPPRAAGADVLTRLIADADVEEWNCGDLAAALIATGRVHVVDEDGGDR